MSNSIDIKITADVVDLRAKFAVAKAESQALTQELNKIAKSNIGMAPTAEMLKLSAASIAAQSKVASLNREMKAAGLSASGFSHDMGLAKTAIDALGVGGVTFGFAELARTMEEVVARAMEFGLSNAKFAAEMGISGEQAAALGAALTAVGANSEEYASVALRMENRLRTSEKAFQQLGMATRNQGGELLSGQALMESAIATMESYRAGTDQNEFALEVFGRTAGQVYDLMRAGSEAQRQYIDDMRTFGVDVGPNATRAAADMEDQLARQKQRWEDVEVAIGQKLMPAVTDFARWLNEDGGTAVKNFEVLLMDWAETATVAGAIVRVGFDVAAAGVREGTDVLVGAYNVSRAAISGDAMAMEAAAKAAWGHMSSDARNAATDIKSAITAIEQQFAGLKSVGDSGSGSIFPSGNRSYVPPASKSEGASGNADAAKQFSQMLDAMNRNDAERDVTLAKLTLDQKKELLQEEFAAHQITAQQLYDLTIAALNKEVEAEKAAQQQILSSDDATLEQRNAAANQIVIIDAQANAAIAAAHRELTADLKKEADAQAQGWKDANREITSAESQLVGDVFNKRQSLNADLLQIGRQLVVQEIQNDLKYWTERGLLAMEGVSSEKMIEQGGVLQKLLLDQMATQSVAVHEAAKTAYVASGTASRVAIQASGDATGLALHKATASQTLLTDAATAAAGAYQSASQIPYVGWILGPVAAAGAFAGVMAFDSFAVGADNIPHDMVANIHKGEMIVPAGPAEALRQGNGSGARGFDMAAMAGSTTQNDNRSVTHAITYAPNVSGVPERNIIDELDGHASEVISMLQRWSRSGAMRF